MQSSGNIVVDMIQSLDSEKLAREIEKQAAKAGRVMDVLIEINSGSEISKSGITCKLFKPQILRLQPKLNQKLCLENQQGPAVLHRELYPVSHDNL